MFHPSRSSLATLALGLVTLGCGDDSSTETGAESGSAPTTSTPAGTTESTPDDSTGTPAPTGGNATGPEATTESPGSSAGDTMGAVPPVIFDLGEIPEAPPFDEACGEVDFLFVIDNSGSMGDEQNTLVNNFPAFINGIQTVLESVDSYNVGVVTTDEYSPNIAGCQELSSLVVQTGGGSSSNANCGPFADGGNFMTENDDLATDFSCAAQVGTSGSASERQMQATVEAVTGVQAGPGECNEGFIREDALLVIVIITDESDNASVGTAQTWYDDIVAAKAGIPENVVVVGIINTPAGGCGFDTAFEISTFIDMFGDNGFQADICLPDYEPIFTEATAIIDVACDNFIPPD